MSELIDQRYSRNKGWLAHLGFQHTTHWTFDSDQWSAFRKQIEGRTRLIGRDPSGILNERFNSTYRYKGSFSDDHFELQSMRWNGNMNYGGVARGKVMSRSDDRVDVVVNYTTLLWIDIVLSSFVGLLLSFYVVAQIGDLSAGIRMLAVLIFTLGLIVLHVIIGRMGMGKLILSLEHYAEGYTKKLIIKF